MTILLDANTKKVMCTECEGSGDCPTHQEHYIDVDLTTPCPNCKNGRCPTCNGMGEITEDYKAYLSNPTFDPRD